MNILAINNKTKNKNMATKKILTDLVSNGDIESTSFIKTGGTSSQFLKADGSVDSTNYTNTNTQLSTEAVQDIVGAMLTGNTETNIAVTYQDADGTIDFVSVNTDTNTQRAIHDTPVNGATTTSISSNWAFDNVKTAVPAGAVFTDTVNTFDGAYSSLSGAPTIPSGNSIVDWTVDLGATNIHVNNYQKREISDTPTDGYSHVAISSNWAFDNVKTAVPSGALFTDTTYNLSGYLLNTTDTFTGLLTLAGNINSSYNQASSSTGAYGINRTLSGRTANARGYRDNTIVTSPGNSTVSYAGVDIKTKMTSGTFDHVTMFQGRTSFDAAIMNTIEGFYMGGLDFENSSSATNYVGYTVESPTANATITNFIGTKVFAPSRTGNSITNFYGLKIETGVSATNKWAIHSPDSTVKSMLIGDIQVGTDIYSNEDTLKVQAGGTSGTWIEISDANGTVEVNADMKANSFIKNSGTSSQFLKADGSIDSTAYLTTGSTQSKYLRSDADDSTNSNLGLHKDKKITFDSNGDNFNYIRTISATDGDRPAGVMVYGSVGGHHFIDGEDDAYDSVTASGFKTPSGTSSQFLKANGSVDSNTYLTSSSTQSKYLRSDQADSTSGTLSSPKFYVGATTSTSQWAFQSRNSASTADSGIYFSSGSGNVFLRNSSNVLSTKINSNGSSYFNGGSLGVGTESPGEKLEVEGTMYATPITYAASQSAYAFKMGASNNTGFDMGIKVKSSSTGVSYISFNDRSEDTLILRGGKVGIKTDNPLSELHVSSGDTTETTLIVGASGTLSDVSSRVFLNEGEGGVTDSKDYGFSLAYDGQGSNYGLAANTFGIIRHNNSATGVAALTIQRDNGNLGVGTDSPDLKVDIISGVNNGLRISATDTTSNWRDISIRSYTSEAQADALPDGVHMFTTNPASATGNAFSKYGGFVIQCREDGNSSFAVRVGASLAEAFFINHNAAATFLSTVTGSNFILSSDKRLKEDIKQVDNKHIDVDWKTFKLKSDNSQNRYGVIAQELEEVHPEFVRTDDKGMKSVAYIDLLIAKIAELEARLDKANI